MNATELVEKIGETLGSTATVKSVFGDPIQVGAKTVVPVAKVAYGFGAGVGVNGRNPDRHGEGGGGGGGVHAYPAGVLEITETDTRFVPFVDIRMVVVAAAAAGMLGLLVGRRRR